MEKNETNIKENQEEEVENRNDEENIEDSNIEENELVTKLDNLEQEKDEIYQRLLRVQAEYDNFRKRTQREKEADAKYRSQSIVTELLPVVDNFERALNAQVDNESTASFVEGIKMVYRQLTDALQKEGVEVIKTEGEVFDPHLHQAVMQVEDEQYDSNVVVEELQKGYLLKDRVIRPAMVKVNQ